MAVNLSTSSLTSRISGLRPEVWLSVGTGFAREDVKALVLSEGKGFVAEAVVTLQEVCLRVTGIAADRVLAPHSRQEILRMLLTEPKILAQMPEIKRLRRQRNFIPRLDLAIQSGRMAFAHSEEEEVYEERLIQSLGPNTSILRGELRALAKAYEAWLGAMNWYDLPLVLHAGIRSLREGWPETLVMPQEVCCLTVQTPESLEREFWDTLGQHVCVRHLDSFHPVALPPTDGDSEISGYEMREPKSFDWQRWHTLDDAAEFLADQIALQIKQHGRGRTALSEQAGPESQNNNVGWECLVSSQIAVLIPDQPSVRRSLKRALDARKIPFAEPRDPTKLRWDENLKWALLTLEVVASNFERQKVVSWLRGHELQSEFSIWVTEINSRGIRSGLGSYAGGLLLGIHTQLVALNSELGGKKTAQEFASAHLKLLKESGYVTGPRLWMIAFFEQLWKILAADMERVGTSEKKAPLLFWLEKLGARIRESSPPVEKLKPTYGVSLYRLQQAPVGPVEQLWVLGLPAEGLSGEGIGDYWFSEREREILSTEFAVRSCTQVSNQRLSVLKVWLSLANKTVFLDSQYDEGGRERESILPILNQLETTVGCTLPQEPREMGSHPRFQDSYGALRPLQPQEMILSPAEHEPQGEMNGGVPEITATAIDRYSRCSFQALTYHRWKLRDVREPDSELWPDVRGNILHEAVRILLGTVDSQGEFCMSPREALERAWNTRRPQGLIRNPRIEVYIKSRMTTVLEVFCEKENAYLKRSQARPVILENLDLRLDYSKFSILGQPDRIDEHADGLFILDYKTSGTLPHGQDMLEMGYRLQLPFYAIAVRKKSGKPVLGVQFIELDKRGGRKSGIFFKKYNGKEPGCLTQVRGNSKSLITANLSVADLGKASTGSKASQAAANKKAISDESPEQASGETWEILEEHMMRDAQSFIEGRFQAKPKLPKRETECNTCGVSDLCGYRRLSVEAEQETSHV
ncbi:MAG: PD-(D/E)XK nuclease family protein [Bdellovibrionia bacterium]